MHVLGQFRDLDDPDSFVWLRGFNDMPTRKRALEAFYDGPVWKQHAAAANATMIDVDNVLLLRPLSVFALETNGRRPAPGSTESQPRLLVATIYPLRRPTAGDLPAFFRLPKWSRRSTRRASPCSRPTPRSTARTTTRHCRYARMQTCSDGHLQGRG